MARALRLRRPAFESPGPLMTVVRDALDVFGVRYESISPQEAEIIVEHHTLVSRMIMTVDEQDRSIRVLSQLPLMVPEGRRTEACEAAMRLMCRTTRTTILLNHESGRVQVSHLLMAADVEPTPGWVRHHVLSVYFAVDTVFAVLSAVANGLADGQDAEELASEIVARRDA